MEPNYQKEVFNLDYKIWNSFSFMNQFRKDPLIITRGEGSYVYDDQGKQYLDAISGLWNVNLGYSRSDIKDFMFESVRDVSSVTLFGRTHKVGIEYSERLLNRLNNDFETIFYTNSGSDAVETAIKISRAYNVLIGNDEKMKIGHFENSYHGVSLGALSVMGISKNLEDMGPTATGSFQMPKPKKELTYKENWQRTKEVLDNQNPDTIAALIVEPILGAGGIIPVTKELLQEIRAYCSNHNIVLIFDEVVTGFGRVGDIFAYKKYGVKPDLITLGKGITSGYAPLGAVLVSQEIYEPFMQPNVMFRHGFTAGGHPISCAAALKTLDILDSEGIYDKVQEKENDLLDVFKNLTKEFDFVDSYRGEGFMYAIELNPQLSGIAKEVAEIGKANGFIYRPIEGEVVVIMLPLNSGRDVIHDLYEKLHKTFLDYQSVNF